MQIPKSEAGPRTNLDSSIQNLDVGSVTQISKTAPRGPQRELALGVLRSWSGVPKEVHTLFKTAIAAKASLSQREYDEALFYLALEEGLLGRYADACAHGQTLLREQHFLSGNDLNDFSDQVAAWHALKSQPSLSVALHGPTQLPTVANLSGRLEADIQTRGISMRVMFDTGAETSVISRSMLERFGVELLSGGTQDTSSSGKVSDVQLAIVPELCLGTIIARNVPVLVEEDAALVVGSAKQKSSLDMIVGYTLMRRFGSFGIVTPGKITLDASAVVLPRRAKLLEVGPTLVLCALANGRLARFLFDTGATKTTLTRNFYETHRSSFANESSTSEAISGIGGSAVLKRFVLPNLRLKFAQGETFLENVDVLPDPSALDVEGQVGNMGRDLWVTPARFQIDFGNYFLTF